MLIVFKLSHEKNKQINKVIWLNITTIAENLKRISDFNFTTKSFLKQLVIFNVNKFETKKI